MKIYGFYHICLTNNWQDVVKDQIDKLVTSKLFTLTDKLYVVVAGSGEISLDCLNKCDDFLVVKRYEDVLCYEFPVLGMMWEEANRRDFYCWYIHTKGVGIDRNNIGFYHGSTDYDYLQECVQDWRHYMEFFTIDKFDFCIRALSKGCDACGVNLREEPNPHFSGNFWWSKSSYIRKLPSIQQIDTEDRWQAEFWVGMAKGELKSLYNNQAGYLERLSLTYKEA